MSSFTRITQHPDTKKWEKADWLDDYFGSHLYGVRFPDGKVFDPENVELKTQPYERKN